MDAAQIAQCLKEKGIRPTPHRISIYDNLCHRCDHPTVDMIFTDMRPQYPTLSRTTVYHTLDELARIGLVRTVTIDSVEIRYDADISLHGHFRCTGCGTLADFPVAGGRLKGRGLEGYEIRTEDVYFTGLCPVCRKGRKS